MRPYTFDEIQRMTYDERLEFRRELQESGEHFDKREEEPIAPIGDLIVKIAAAEGKDVEATASRIFKADPASHQAFRQQSYW